MELEKPRISLLAIPEVAPSTLFGMHDIFSSAGRDWANLFEDRKGESALNPQIVARRGTELLRIGNGVQIVPDSDLSEVPDVVCVPEAMILPSTSVKKSHEIEIDWLSHCYKSGAIVATVCSGAILLAETGLLAGEEATTHWAFSDALASYPNVKVNPRRALIVGGHDGRLLMAGGGTSWEDLALYIVAKLVSVEEAMALAKLFLINWHDVGQLPFAILSHSRQNDDAVVARCQSWIASNYEQTSPVASMLQISGLPERSFSRRFKKATGLSPMHYVHNVRLEESKQLLESSDEPVEVIAELVGYEDAAFFGRLFRRKVGVTPALYRKRFRGMRKTLEMSRE